MGKKLLHLLKNNGFIDLKVSLNQPILEEKWQREYIIMRAEKLGQKAVDEKLITKSDLNETIKQLKRLIKDESSLITGAPLYQAAGMIENNS